MSMFMWHLIQEFSFSTSEPQTVNSMTSRVKVTTEHFSSPNATLVFLKSWSSTLLLFCPRHPTRTDPFNRPEHMCRPKHDSTFDYHFSLSAWRFKMTTLQFLWFFFSFRCYKPVPQILRRSVANTGGLTNSGPTLGSLDRMWQCLLITFFTVWERKRDGSQDVFEEEEGAL